MLPTDLSYNAAVPTDSKFRATAFFIASANSPETSSPFLILLLKESISIPALANCLDASVIAPVAKNCARPALLFSSKYCEVESSNAFLDANSFLSISAFSKLPDFSAALISR